MSHPTDWDVTQYKCASESAEQWDLRRRFMERWKSDIPEDRLVCLARVFTNIEFLGCRYPAAVMRQVAELSKEVAREYRDKKKTKLQRTFVSASDAAVDKAKRTKRPHSDEPTSSSFIPNKKIAFVSSTNNTSVDNRQNIDDSYQNERPSFNTNFNYYQQNNQLDNSHVQNQRYADKKPLNRSQTVNVSSIYGNLVLIDRREGEPNYMNKLHDSCQTSKVKIEWLFKTVEEGLECTCQINDKVVYIGVGKSQKLAKEVVAVESWKKLQSICYTIIEIQGKHNESISLKDLEAAPKAVDPLNVKVESSVASRMMKMMGWKGGALGVSGNGISEPIAINLKHITRAGIGVEFADKNIMNSLKAKINEYKMLNDTKYDLAFTTDFTKEERAEMHKLAQRLGLKSKSYGRDDQRYLVISKPMSPIQIVQTLCESGGANYKYKLIKPNQSK